MRLFRNSLTVSASNIIAYGLAALIFTFGSMLVITAPPLLYGFVSMLLKGANQEKVKIGDVFDGFRSGNFVRSWIYAFFILAVIILLLVVWMMLYFFAGILIVMSFALTGAILPETITIALMVIISIILAFIVTFPAILVLYVLPLFIIKKYTITEAISESIGLVRGNFVASVILCTIIGLVALAGVVPYYAGMFLQWPMAVNLSVYIAGIILTTPLSQQILVTATVELIEEENLNSSFVKSDKKEETDT
ncbi:hypothetical protein [Methanolobus sp.]|uniref:hypothetical protein n=1 Tax=Methanolobus sp. TaxID=1874737 RepID=UPI0025E8C5FA|nr:hypothetical protein [Methanolobus sp.]